MARKNISLPIEERFAEVVATAMDSKAHAPRSDAQRVKSPLRYPGGKSRAVKTILERLPAGIDTLCAPFVGGGSVELAAASQLGIQVYAYDAFEPLVSFWQCVLDAPHQLAELVRKHYPLSRSKFYSLQKRFVDIGVKQEVAAAFFVLNRASFSGTSLSGGMSPKHPRFTEESIMGLENFKVDRFSVKKADFTESIPQHQNDFMYLDPPYANGGALYGNKGDYHVDFKHETLAALLKARDGWLLSYNDCELVRDLYAGYEIITPEWTYGMSANKTSKEVLIIASDLMRVS